MKGDKMKFNNDDFNFKEDIVLNKDCSYEFKVTPVIQITDFEDDSKYLRFSVVDGKLITSGEMELDKAAKQFTEQLSELFEKEISEEVERRIKNDREEK